MSSEKEPPAKKPAAGQRGPADVREREMGEALRSVYDEAVQESVPDELLDLLSKLD
ncbi:NepR family anti-sigma factor [uncultured Sphingomonas sp.]|uniref:NepR family anti-sigma factor n=1 Tax=uncultured Sphingomonas sp. TaxID=158754 RepID=UPI0035CB03B0